MPKERRTLLKDTIERLAELVGEETPDDIETDTDALTGVVHEPVLATAAELDARLIVIAAADTQAQSGDLGPYPIPCHLAGASGPVRPDSERERGYQREK